MRKTLEFRSKAFSEEKKTSEFCYESFLEEKNLEFRSESFSEEKNFGIPFLPILLNRKHSKICSKPFFGTENIRKKDNFC
jgi:hypothetical protein